MTSRESRLWEMKYEKYLIAAYSPLCVAAGYDTAQFGGVDCFALATKIQGQVRRSAKVITKGSFSETDYLGALKQMTVADLRAMRERIDYKPL
jgi:hypothetical protein